jgi:hypothetical protein
LGVSEGEDLVPHCLDMAYVVFIKAWTALTLQAGL